MRAKLAVTWVFLSSRDYPSSVPLTGILDAQSAGKCPRMLKLKEEFDGCLLSFLLCPAGAAVLQLRAEAAKAAAEAAVRKGQLV